MEEQKHSVLVVNEFHPETVEKLDTLYDTHHLWKCAEQDKAAFVSSLNEKCRAAATASWMCDSVVYELESLELIAAFGVGVDGIDFTETRKHKIRVSNTPDVLNDAVADLAIALLLATTRNLVNADRFARSGAWRQGPFPFGAGLAGKTLGIIGMGRIGEEIALRALPLKLNIAYHNRNAKDLPYAYCPSIEELAKNSDILLCMLPGGEETNNLIDENVFQKLGSEGIFINVGRGNSVDESALATALKNKSILAAGLDVYKDEPNIPDEFLGLDNLVLLPHIGSSTVETRREMGNMVLRNLAAYFDNNSLVSEVI